MHRIWRLLYRLIGSRAFVAVAAAPLQLTRLLAGPLFARRILGWLGRPYRRLLLSWPRRQPMYFNMDFSRLWRRLGRRVGRTPPAPLRRPAAAPGSPPRIGLLGPFSVLYNYHERLLEGFPAGADLHLFDTRYKRLELRPASYLAPLASSYQLVDLRDRPEPGNGYEELLDEAARVINQASLDLLVVLFNVPVIYDLLDRLDAPAVAEVCMISDLIHHPRVDFHLYPQPSADYFPLDGHLFCGVSRGRFSDRRVYPGFIYFDLRDIRPAVEPGWSERDRLIVFHGLLYKLASPPFLDTLFELLADDAGLDLVYYGKDLMRAKGRSATELISARARRFGVQGRVHYAGEFSAVRDASGRIGDDGWQRCVADLRRARLAPDPWPIGGGSARFEAYALGTPSVHMRVRLDPASWGRPQHALLELPDLLVERGSTTTIDGYRELSRRCLYEQDFAERLAAEQLAAVRRVSDAEAWWRQLLDLHDRWRRETARQGRNR